MLKLLNIYQSAISKKDKPIMTKEKYDNLFNFKTNRTTKILDGLSIRNKQRIGEWLDTIEVKVNVDGEPYIASPFSFRSTIYIYKDVSYAFLYEWCAVNFERIRLAKLPKPLDIIIYYANKWKKNPTINPYTNKKIPISLNPNGEYVRIYKKILDGLIDNILNTKTKKGASSGKRLSIEYCYKLKESLPIEHTCVFSDKSTNSKYQIYYDYLFIVYFIKSKTSQYDPAFQSELSIYIDLAVYNTSQFEYNEGETYIDFHYTSQYLYIFKFYKNYLLNMSESELSIHNLIIKLCIDIDNTILCMREPQETKITNAMIDKIKFNMNVLRYCEQIFSKVPFNYFLEYIENPEKKNNKIILKEYLIFVLTKNEKNIPERYNDISNRIMFYMGDEDYLDNVSPSSNVFETVLSMYDTILKLYMDNKKNTNYKPIKDPYNINKGIEPQIPVKQQLPRELQMYNIRLNNFKNAPANSSNERKLKVFEEANSSNKRKLKEFEENMKGQYDEKLKKYVFKKDVYDRIYEGKYSPKQRKELLSLNAYKRLKKDEPLLHVSNRKAKSYGSYGSYGSVGKIHHSEHSGNLKAFTTISDKKNNNRGNNGNNSNSSSYKEVEGYYVNDNDPYTLEEFSDMTPKKRKYATDIIYNDGKKEYHYRFDTISIYNYIVKCIDFCEKPINFFNRIELTDDDLDQICKKIKHFTKKPTYNLFDEIRPLLVDCSKYYNNYLEFEWEEDVKEGQEQKGIIGSINIYIAIRLGDIKFKIIEKEVLKLPIIINSNKLDKFSYEILQLLQDKLSEDVFITRRFFPYRKNKPILNLPKFPFSLNDNVDKTLERLTRYRSKIEQM